MTQPARVLVADPPWPFKDKLPGGGRGAEKHYPVMSMHDIYSYNLPPLATDAWLFLWRVASMPTEALTTVMVWGFVPKAEIVWVKTTATGSPAMGMGRSVRNCHETCIVATRGRPARKSASVLSVFSAPRRQHSEKPDEFYDLIETLCEGPYAELFARRARAGWSCYGNDVGGGDVPVPRVHERSSEHRLVSIDGVPAETYPFLPTGPEADTAVIEVRPATCPDCGAEYTDNIADVSRCFKGKHHQTYDSRQTKIPGA